MRLTPALWLVVDALAGYRLTRLTTKDRITERVRKIVRDRLGSGAFDFVTCPWCVGVWIAAAVVALTALAPDPWSYVACGLALAAVAGVLSEAI